jgi:regulator of protease activity HflC (stomatin/prohibitin superfamily)
MAAHGHSQAEPSFGMAIAGRANVGVDQMSLTELTHFRSAQNYIRPLAIVGWAGACIGLVSMVIAIGVAVLFPFGSVPDLGFLAVAGASMVIAAAGFLTSAPMCRGRYRLVLDHEQKGELQRPGTPDPDQPAVGTLARHSDHLARVAGRPQSLVTALLAGAAAAGILISWPERPVEGGTEALLLCSGILFIAAFPVLVLERIYSKTPSAALPEAEGLACLLRVPLLALVGGGFGLALAAAGFRLSVWVERMIAVAILIIALELLGRAFAALFSPPPDLEAARSIADSSCARLIRLELPSLSSINRAAQRQLGIDLSRSWALAFMRQAAVPIGAGLFLLGWCLTGVSTLALDERGIYERMGVPVEVLRPGLHVLLPWPVGIVRRVEYGVIHEAPIVAAEKDVTTSEPRRDRRQTAQMAHAEDLAPISADRLWNTPHAFESTYLLASEEGGTQSFQIVNIDMRLVYRIGLSDEAALIAAYQVSEPDALVRATASELLARYFASHTLLGVLGEDREAIASDLKAALQRRLDDLSGGIEVLAVVIEAIHPPPGAAYEYHRVQAAKIDANAIVAREQASAVQQAKQAERDSINARNAALSVAAEIVGAANIEEQLFNADNRSEQDSGKAFLFERWLERLSHGLGKAQMVVIDHRLAGADAPTIDLRSLSPLAKAR